MIILGNKNSITDEDKNSLSNKVDLIHYVDITHPVMMRLCKILKYI